MSDGQDPRHGPYGSPSPRRSPSLPPIVDYVFCHYCHAKRGIPTTCTSCGAAICDECVELIDVRHETALRELKDRPTMQVRLCYECSDRRKGV